MNINEILNQVKPFDLSYSKEKFLYHLKENSKLLTELESQISCNEEWQKVAKRDKVVYFILNDDRWKTKRLNSKKSLQVSTSISLIGPNGVATINLELK